MYTRDRYMWKYLKNWKELYFLFGASRQETIRIEVPINSYSLVESCRCWKKIVLHLLPKMDYKMKKIEQAS